VPTQKKTKAFEITNESFQALQKKGNSLATIWAVRANRPSKAWLGTNRPMKERRGVIFIIFENGTTFCKKEF
jgi:hypothetical protein